MQWRNSFQARHAEFSRQICIYFLLFRLFCFIFIQFLVQFFYSLSSLIFFLLFIALQFFFVHHFLFSLFSSFLFANVIFLIVCLSATFQLFSCFSFYSLYLDFYFFFSFLTFICRFHGTHFYSILSFFCLCSFYRFWLHISSLKLFSLTFSLLSFALFPLSLSPNFIIVFWNTLSIYIILLFFYCSVSSDFLSIFRILRSSMTVVSYRKARLDPFS